jgi:hypothetical protein
VAGWFILVTEVFIAAALVLSTPVMASAQNASPPAAGAATSRREGNIYGHRKHQPRERRHLAESASQVDDEVKALLMQTYDLDKTFANGSE